MLGVSLGLILIAATSKPYNPNKALVELDQILKLKSLWKLNWIEAHAETRPHLFIIGEPITYSQFLEKKYKNPMYQESRSQYTSANSLNLSRPGESVFAIELVTKSQKTTHVLRLPDKYWESSIAGSWLEADVFPVTLNEFQKWWESLPLTFYVPKNVYLPGDFENDGKSVGYFFPKAISDDKMKKHKEIQLHKNLPLGESIFQFIGYEGNDTYLIKVNKYDTTFVSRTVLSQIFGNWTDAPYEFAFYDLKEASKGMESLDLERVSQKISEEATKGSEVFEAFGMKFPASQVNIWGVIAVLGVQLYLFTYLRQLSGKLQLNVPGWDVPWIGTDSSFLGRAMFLVSLALLPPASLISLGGTSLIHAKQSGTPLSKWILAAWICVVLISGSLAFLSWRVRPKLTNAADIPADEASWKD